MNVKDLIQQLERIENKDQPIFVIMDEKPMRLAEMAGPVECAYKNWGRCLGDGNPEQAGLREVSEGAMDYGFTEEDVLKDGHPCIGLWLA